MIHAHTILKNPLFSHAHACTHARVSHTCAHKHTHDSHTHHTHTHTHVTHAHTHTHTHTHTQLTHLTCICTHTHTHTHNSHTHLERICAQTHTHTQLTHTSLTHHCSKPLQPAPLFTALPSPFLNHFLFERKGSTRLWRRHHERKWPGGHLDPIGAADMHQFNTTRGQLRESWR